MSLRETPKLNAEGYCQNCCQPLGITGVCTVCEIEKLERQCPYCRGTGNSRHQVRNEQWLGDYNSRTDDEGNRYSEWWIGIAP